MILRTRASRLYQKRMTKRRKMNKRARMRRKNKI
jgi:hypothetical protein